MNLALATAVNQQTMPIVLLSRLMEVAVSHGFGYDWMCTVADVPFEELSGQGAACTISQRLRLIDAIDARRPIAGLGLLAGRRIQISDHGIVGYAILSSANLFDALEIISRYHPLSNPAVRFTYHVDGDNLILFEAPIFPFNDVQNRYHLEEMLAAWIPIGALLNRGSFDFLRLNVPWSRPSYHFMYEEFFRCTIKYDQPECSLVLPKSRLEERIALGNPELALLCEQQCAIISHEQYHTSHIGYQVQRLLLARPGSFPSFSSVAEQLRMSERSLRRHLADAGTSFRELLDKLRIRIASRYLQDTDIPVQTISGLIGYSAATNFHRAFKRSTGLTPDQYRSRSRDALPPGAGDQRIRKRR